VGLFNNFSYEIPTIDFSHHAQDAFHSNVLGKKEKYFPEARIRIMVVYKESYVVKFFFPLHHSKRMFCPEGRCKSCVK
jgi:hypothetical protein